MRRPPFKNIVGHQYNGWTVLDFYSIRYQHTSQEQWERWINEGAVERNGKKAAAGDAISTGDILIFQPEAAPEPTVSRDYRIVFEDQHVIVIDKPAGLPVMPSGIFYFNTLLSLLRANRETKNIHPAHRIDIDTSGLVVFSKTGSAAALLARGFRERLVYKEYRTLLSGKLEHEITVTAPIGKLPRTDQKFSYGISRDGKEAHTVFVPIRHSAPKDLTLARAVPLTGRVHQIRIHAAHMRMPIVGDQRYGNFSRSKTGSRDHGVRREKFALHSSILSFPHPEGEKCFRSDAPVWFETLLS